MSSLSDTPNIPDSSPQFSVLQGQSKIMLSNTQNSNESNNGSNQRYAVGISQALHISRCNQISQSSLPSRPSRLIRNCLFKLLCNTALAMLNPPTCPILLLGYNPELAIATWQGSTPAVRPMKVTERAMTLPNSPGFMYSDSRKEVCSCQRRMSIR
jgi:hypothetical protein